jgi:5-hydroxyisourate hydrolase
MPSLSTHVIDSSTGGPMPGVAVHVHNEAERLVAAATTGPDGRSAVLAERLTVGRYRVTWDTGGNFIDAVSVTIALSEDRHYHVPLLSSPASAMAYLGA